MVERPLCKRKVSGSNPLTSTKLKGSKEISALFYFVCNINVLRLRFKINVPSEKLKLFLFVFRLFILPCFFLRGTDSSNSIEKKQNQEVSETIKMPTAILKLC